MTCVIFDSTNNGVLHITEQYAVGNLLMQGILDCETTLISKDKVSYNQQSLNTCHVCWNRREVKLELMAPESINNFYLEKKELITLRTPYMTRLAGLVRWSTRKAIHSVLPGVEADIQFALLNSNVANEQYHPSINDYALINNMSLSEAYTELKLITDSYSIQKIRAYAYLEYFSKMINSTNQDVELKLILKEMEKKFIQDSYI